MNLNRAHLSALDLLKIVDEFCVKNEIKYTIAADTIIDAGNKEFSECAPNIYIAVFYAEYLKIKDYLEIFCKDNVEYSIHNYMNTKQFFTCDMWFVKTEKWIVEQVEEYFYYGSKLVITPIFYAGNRKQEWVKIYKEYRNLVAAHNLAAMLPGKSIYNRIGQLPKTLRTKYYTKLRNVLDFERFVEKHEDNAKSVYTLYPYVSMDFSGSSKCPWVVKKTSLKMTEEVWKNVERINLWGIECFCLKERNKLIKCYSKVYIENVKKRKSRLVVEGGEKLRRIQLIQIELLQEFDRICRKNDLRYNISFGTLLGAIRHGGFIPWDDDIDVTMPWEDYNKLDEAMRQDLDATQYYYRTPETEANNHLIFKHLEKKGTIYTKPGREKLEHEIGVFIDIFPMYPAAPNAVADWFHTRICRYWRTALWATIGAKSEKNILKRLYYSLISLPGNKVCYKKFVEAALFYKKQDNNYKFWIAMDRNPYNVALVNKENYENLVEVDFEGGKYYVSETYCDVLDYCFGQEWKRYPSVYNRIPLHDANIEIGELYEMKGE